MPVFVVCGRANLTFYMVNITKYTMKRWHADVLSSFVGKSGLAVNPNFYLMVVNTRGVYLHYYL